MRNRRNYYRVLQVQPDASIEVIRASYRAIMRELKQHPDLGGEHWNATILNEAYETLCDSKKRAEYDRKLFEQYTKIPISRKNLKKPLITIFCPFCKRPLARNADSDECCPTCRSPLLSQNEDKLREACRRSVARIKKSGQIRYYSSWPQKGQGAEMINLSSKGMRFVCTERLSPNAIIKISSPLLKATARVTHCHKILRQQRTFYTVGVYFLTVTFANPKGSFVATCV
jgi:curved DNA-binding protein CbpA